MALTEQEQQSLRALETLFGTLLKTVDAENRQQGLDPLVTEYNRGKAAVLCELLLMPGADERKAKHLAEHKRQQEEFEHARGGAGRRDNGPGVR